VPSISLLGSYLSAHPTDPEIRRNKASAQRPLREGCRRRSLSMDILGLLFHTRSDQGRILHLSRGSRSDFLSALGRSPRSSHGERRPPTRRTVLGNEERSERTRARAGRAGRAKLIRHFCEHHSRLTPGLEASALAALSGLRLTTQIPRPGPTCSTTLPSFPTHHGLIPGSRSRWSRPPIQAADGCEDRSVRRVVAVAGQWGRRSWSSDSRAGGRDPRTVGPEVVILGHWGRCSRSPARSSLPKNCEPIGEA
jgi:hypothetical protein